MPAKMDHHPVPARRDPALYAIVQDCRPLHYRAGADPLLDRPPHVRAGSSLVHTGSVLVVIQDDANFVALINPATSTVEAIPLPAGYDGQRQFDDQRGNKQLKLDLEALALLADGSLLAFGSGSAAQREYVATISNPHDTTPAAHLYHAPAFYAALRAATAFSGAELNLEGALHLPGIIRLFGRGNGAPRADLAPVDATCDIDLGALQAYLKGERPEPPLPAAIRQYTLGAIAGQRLTFTDATVIGDTILFAAAAEASPDATRDGPVAGSAIGIFDTREQVRLAELHTPEGHPFDGKVEGLAADPFHPDRIYAIVDRDDPERPSELCTVALTGPWLSVTPPDQGS